MPHRSDRLSRLAAAVRGLVEPLEARRLLCYGPDALPGHPTFDLASNSAVPRAPAAESMSVAPSSAPLAASGLPLLHSLPGARAAVFLDFDGYGNTYAPYDTDGVPAAFGPFERADIEYAWRHVSSYFSMFDLDVTTEQPPPAVPYSYSIISNSIATAGFNYGSFPSTQPTNFNPAVDARYRPTGLAHEIGHSFDLAHQSAYDARGNKVAEYFGGYDALHGALMGVDYAREVHKWFIGHPSTSPAELQDDVATIAGRVGAFTGGDGFRPDDVPGALADAVRLSLDAEGRSSASGIIERLSDADAYSFESAGGAFRIDVTPPAPSMLDAKVEVYAADGSLVAAADGAGNDQHLVLQWLAEGTYYAVVKSHGNYADLGPYDLVVRAVEDGTPAPEPSGPPPRLTAAAGAGISVTWDEVPDAAGYVIERSADGAAWQQVGDLTAPATTFADAPPAGGHRYFYRVITVTPSGRSAPSGVAHVVSRLAPVTELGLTIWASGFVLNWHDTSGEVGYRIDRRAEPPGDAPGPWVVIGEVGSNVPSISDAAVSPGVAYRYRVTAVGADGAETAAAVKTPSPLTAVTGLHAVAAPDSYHVRLDWDPIEFPAGYGVYRSTNGGLFVPYGNVATGTTTYLDTGTEAATVYSYRVTGNNVFGQSASATVTVVTGGDPLPDEWIVEDVGGSAAPQPGETAYWPGNESFVTAARGAGLIDLNGEMLPRDSFRFVYRTMVGDFSISAVVVSSIVPLDTLAGIMIREGTAPAAPYVFAGVSRRHGTGTLARTSSPEGFRPFGGVASTTLRITRNGNFVEVHQLSGSSWVGRASYNIAMGAPVQVGLVCASGGDAATAAARFENVVVAPGAPPRVWSPARSFPQGSSGDVWSLRVLGDDSRGESTLVYTWSVDSLPAGAPPPQFNLNNTNGAKNTIATFFGSGMYRLRATITNLANLSTYSTVDVHIVPVATDVYFAPGTVTVRAGATRVLAPTVIDQYGRVATSPTAGPRSWSAARGRFSSPPGSFTGAYVAPSVPGWDRVVATVGSFTATLWIFVYDDFSPALLSVVSRKVHANRGAVDLPLDIYGTSPIVEPRRGGPTTLVFTFSGDVSVLDGLLDANDFSIGNATFHSARIDGRVLTLELRGLVDRDAVYVNAVGLGGRGGAALIGDTDVEIRSLYGDATRDGVVNAADAAVLRTRTGRRGGPTDLLYDLDLDGVISATDQAAARRRIVPTVLAEPQAAPAVRAAPARRSAY